MTRLHRQRSRGGQLGWTFAIVALLGTLSYFLLRYAEDWLMSVVGTGFGGIAALLLLAGFHQTMALRTPETVVEIDREAITPGQPVTLRVMQPGNASFESLRVNLVGEEQIRQRKTWNRSVFETLHFFDSGRFDGALDRTIVVDVPRHLEPTSSELRRRVRWTLEVWGRVRGRANFQHVYDVFVQKP
ncbi:MAG TPA: hypothetical protein VNI54_16880 [Thermoanaerobaculia bacterium]|nr:hypothetical protein [Thermoanaerobaculia bacterium]